jgi:hypothetical protein
MRARVVSSYPDVAHDYERLRLALEHDVYPAERHYLDFKLAVYTPESVDGKTLKGTSKAKAHDGLARNMASFGIRGGHLIYGVREDKEQHLFQPVEMDLPEHIESTVVDVARTRIRPSLDVIPHVLSRPDQRDRGFLVIEIPESPNAPHMVNGTYYGRSEAGKVVLTDAEVEEYILRRGRMGSQLEQAMSETREVDNSLDNDPGAVSHMLFTAVPTTPWPEMFLAFTRNKEAQQGFFSGIVMDTLNAINRLGGDRGYTAVAFDNLVYMGRTARGHGARFATWNVGVGSPADDKERWLGVGDGGTVRFINLEVSSLPDGRSQAATAIGAINERRGRPVLYQHKIAWQVSDIVRLIGSMAEKVDYHGSWLVGLEVDKLQGLSGATGGVTLDSVCHSYNARFTTHDLVKHPQRSANAMMRPLFRDLGIEGYLSPDD